MGRKEGEKLFIKKRDSLFIKKRDKELIVIAVVSWQGIDVRIRFH